MENDLSPSQWKIIYYHPNGRKLVIIPRKTTRHHSYGIQLVINQMAVKPLPAKQKTNRHQLNGRYHQSNVSKTTRCQSNGRHAVTTPMEDTPSSLRWKTRRHHFNGRHLTSPRLTLLLTVRVAGTPQMILQPVSSICLCSPLPSRTWQTPEAGLMNVVINCASGKPYSPRLSTVLAASPPAQPAVINCVSGKPSSPLL